jgi:hypothetical protein
MTKILSFRNQLQQFVLRDCFWSLMKAGKPYTKNLRQIDTLIDCNESCRSRRLGFNLHNYKKKTFLLLKLPFIAVTSCCSSSSIHVSWGLIFWEREIDNFWSRRTWYSPGWSELARLTRIYFCQVGEGRSSTLAASNLVRSLGLPKAQH